MQEPPLLPSWWEGLFLLEITLSTSLLTLYSQNHWLADGIDTVWNFTFADGYINTAYVKAYKVSAAGVRTEITVTSGMFVGPFQLKITPAVPEGSRLVIYRDTPKNVRLVDFSNGARVDEISLDLIGRQALHVCAEVLDGARVDFAGDDVGFRSLRHNEYTGISTVQADDNGKAHVKRDGTAVVIPAALPATTIFTVINDNVNAITVTAESPDTIYLQGSTSSGSVLTLLAHQAATFHKVNSTDWYASGYATMA